MGYKSLLIRPYARSVSNTLQVRMKAARKDQQRIFRSIVKSASKTSFGQDHDLASVQQYADFQSRVPIRDYEALRPYVDRMVAGERDILWPGRPKYYAKTSGTTSGSKYIPLTRASAPTHVASARTALMNYSYQTGNMDVWDGKMIFLSGSPELSDTAGVPTGRLSGIVNHMVPSWIRPNQLPSYATNCIADWETKLDYIVEETIDQDMRLISGIPPWVVMYMERLLEKSDKKTIRELFPKFSLLVHGGVNFRPYEAKLKELIGDEVDMLETYPASEGFIAFQQDPGRDDLLLNTWSGIFYEFIPHHEIGQDHPTRLTLEEVTPGERYALLLTTDAGLWAYSIGDTVEITGTDPYTLRVAGRVAHYISAFGEHVIGDEVDRAMMQACSATGAVISEYTVAPQVNPVEGLPYHEWFIEWDHEPGDVSRFAQILDEALCVQNSYYNDLISGQIIRPAVLRSVRRDGFQSYMQSIGKLGGQNKLPRLSNNRKLADAMHPFIR